MNNTTRAPLNDYHGNPMTGANASAVELYDKALEQFGLYTDDPVATIDSAIEQEPHFVMAHILKAWAFLLSTEPEAMQEAASIVTHARNLDADDRAASHIHALDAVLLGNWSEAASRLDTHNMMYPRDFLAIQAGHLIDFFRANARSLRDRIARILPHWSREDAAYPVVLGMHAFGLEESGDYGRAEETGLMAIDLQPMDSWAHHAVAHVLEMQGRFSEGHHWMQSRLSYWSGSENFFRVHNWWHWAVTHLNVGQFDKALNLYDGPIREEESAVAVDLVDASSLLWRLDLLGHDVGDRWAELATIWSQHADGKSYAFNDWHAAMAYLGAEQFKSCEELLKQCLAHPVDGTEAQQWARHYGAQLIAGFTAFRQGDYEKTIRHLQPSRHIANAFGGSHAQRDVIDCTLIEAAIRAGANGIAQALAAERLSLRPALPMNLDFQRRAAR